MQELLGYLVVVILAIMLRLKTNNLRIRDLKVWRFWGFGGLGFEGVGSRALGFEVRAVWDLGFTAGKLQGGCSGVGLLGSRFGFQGWGGSLIRA